jgi:hypothetical protein
MTLLTTPVDVQQDSGMVDAEDFVQRLIGRGQLERDDDLEHGEFGLRDLATGRRIRVPVTELTRYAAVGRDRLERPFH